MSNTNGHATGTTYVQATPYTPDGTEITATPDKQQAKDDKTSGHNRLRRFRFKTRARRRGLRAFLVLLILGAVASIAVNWYIPHTDAAREDRQDAAVAKLSELYETVSKTPFPTAQAASTAYPIAFQAALYNDQATAEVIQAVRDATGWNGHGVANLASLYWDQDPRLTYLSGDYAAIPFRLRFTYSPVPMEPQLLYVLTKKGEDGTITTLGQGTYFMSPPTFVWTGGNKTDASPSADSSNPAIQTVKQFLAGEDRFTVPGVQLPMANGSLKPSSSSNYVVYGGTDAETVVAFDVQFDGPTTGAAFTQRLAAKLSKNSDGEWRVAALGLDANQGG